MATEQETAALVPVDLTALTIPQLAEAARGLGPALAGKIREDAQKIRAERVGSVHDADTFALIRSLAAAHDVLSAVADGFTAGAAAAQAEAAEDLVAVHGEQDGIPQGRLVVPDLDGTEVVVNTAWKSGARTWSTDTIVETLTSLARLEACDGDDLAALPADVEAAYLLGVETGARRMHTGLDTIGALKDPSATKVDALARVLAGTGRDRLARALQAASVAGARVYVGVTLKREAAKARRRR